MDQTLILGILTMLIPTIPSLICAYYAYKANKQRKRGKPKGKRHKGKIQKPKGDCILYIRSDNKNKSVDIKTTAHASKLIAVVFIKL